MKALKEIDIALDGRNVKRAEVAIAKQLRAELDDLDQAALLWRRAQARLLNARPDDALQDVQSSIDLSPALANEPHIQTLLGDIFFARFELAPPGFLDRTDAEIAIKHYEAALEKDEGLQKAWIYYQLGRIALSDDDSSLAERYFRLALREPNEPADSHALCYERLGFLALYERRDPSQALQHFQAATKLYPPDDSLDWQVQVFLQISRAYLGLYAYDEAVQAARQALRLATTPSLAQTMLPEAYITVGEVFSQIPNRENEAIEHYLNFLQSTSRPQGIDVTWSQVHEAIGMLSMRLTRYQQAAQSLEKALQFNPYHPWELTLKKHIARCYYHVNDYDRALDILETVFDEDTTIDDWQLYQLYGNSLYGATRLQDAIQAYRKALQLAPHGALGTKQIRTYLDICHRLIEEKA